jgi:hypothetical protein
LSDADIRASSDRYLRNAIIAVLAHDRRATLWDAARLLSVGEEGYAYRRTVGAAVRALPEIKEISAFFTGELTAQLADARSTTTAKLDAPVNKLARLLNSPSIKRVLLNDSLRVDFDQVIAAGEVLVVKGALGVMGAGNTSTLMQLLVGMLDAALARQQDLVEPERRVAVALKIDEAPLVLNRGFAETMALKRSAGLETVACWQTDAQWIDRDVRDQLDGLFAHRVYFATASARDARDAVALTMAEFSDTVRPGIEHLSALGHPDVRLHLPRHHAVASWCTPAGRQAPFVAQTLPLRVDRERLAIHAARQRERGGRHLTDLRQPHWQRALLTAPSEPDAQRAASAVDASASGARSHADPVTEPPSDSADSSAAVALADGAGLTAHAPAGESLRELVALDRAARVRLVRPTDRREHDPDALDIEILLLVARLGHVLTSQIHGRFNAGRAATTTQRRLKRLADAGLLERMQFHRRDGGGMPMCCAITARGRSLLAPQLASSPSDGRDAHADRASPASLRQVRRDAHLAGWILALERVLGGCFRGLRGAAESVLEPPARDHGRIIGPSDLRLPAGRTPHDFLHTDGTGTRVEVERFATLRPDAIVELVPWSKTRPEPSGEAGARVDLMVELDDRVPEGGNAAKLERYDHFLSGWSVATRRYGSGSDAVPAVVFVCRDSARARRCALAADSVLLGCRAYAGEYPFDWEYLGRERVMFAAESDVHAGSLRAYAVAHLPPAVRVAASHGDPRAAHAETRTIELLAG